MFFESFLQNHTLFDFTSRSYMCSHGTEVFWKTCHISLKDIEPLINELSLIKGGLVKECRLLRKNTGAVFLGDF